MKKALGALDLEFCFWRHALSASLAHFGSIRAARVDMEEPCQQEFLLCTQYHWPEFDSTLHLWTLLHGGGVPFIQGLLPCDAPILTGTSINVIPHRGHSR